MTATTDQPTPPIVCDMTDAPDTTAERIARYETLFTQALVGRERTDDGIRFRLRADPWVEEEATELAALDKACCAFFTFTITRHGDEIWWATSVPDDDIARAILDEYYNLPDTVTQGTDALFERFNDAGMDVVITDGDTTRPATRDELGLTSG